MVAVAAADVPANRSAERARCSGETSTESTSCSSSVVSTSLRFMSSMSPSESSRRRWRRLRATTRSPTACPPPAASLCASRDSSSANTSSWMIEGESSAVATRPARCRDGGGEGAAASSMSESTRAPERCRVDRGEAPATAAGAREVDAPPAEDVDAADEGSRGRARRSTAPARCGENHTGGAACSRR